MINISLSKILFLYDSLFAVIINLPSYFTILLLPFLFFRQLFSITHLIYSSHLELIQLLTKLLYFLQTSFCICYLWYTVLPLLLLVENLFRSPRDRIMRGFLNISMVYQVVFSEIALFYFYTTVVDEFGKVYKSNRNIIRIHHLIDLDIVQQLGSLYIFYSYLHLTISFLLF